MCDCRSYNRPDWGGNKKEVILEAPKWSQKKNGICIDSCIVEQIKALWAAGIVTRGCCCGHNLKGPSVIIDETENPKNALSILRENDNRKWTVQRFEIISYT